MRNQTNVRHNGVYRNITNFNYSNGVASGIISGKFTSVTVGNYKNPTKRRSTTTEVSTAKHALVDEHDRLFGNKLMTYSESSKYGHGMRNVRDTHIKRLENGKSVATGVVDGKAVSVMYDGKAVSEDGVEMDAKPWLRDVRKDLVAAAERPVAKKEMTMTAHLDSLYPTFVTDAFIGRLKRLGFEIHTDENNLVTASIGADTVKLNYITDGRTEWHSQLTVCREIDRIYDIMKARKEKITQQVDRYFERWTA